VVGPVTARRLPGAGRADRHDVLQQGRRDPLVRSESLARQFVALFDRKFQAWLAALLPIENPL